MAKYNIGKRCMIKAPISRENALNCFEDAAANVPPPPDYNGSGIVICAGGPFVPSAYVVVRLLRYYGVALPIEVWHAGKEEIPDWAERAFEPWDVTLHDATRYYPDRPAKELRGWPIKSAALVNSRQRHTLFLDADCFPLRNLEFILASAEYRQAGALFWPDNKHHKMTPDGTIWDLTGLTYRGDVEFETGIFALDKLRNWPALHLAQWLNANSTFWYNHVMGDKDTFYLALRKYGAPYLMAPACKRHSAVVTRHFWFDGSPLVDHRTGASKYSLPQKRGPFHLHLLPYEHRSSTKNVYDELMQRFFVRDFSSHIKYLNELNLIYEG